MTRVIFNCDACGRESLEWCTVNVQISWTHPYNNHNLSLCRDCAEDLDAYMRLVAKARAQSQEPANAT